MVRYENVMRVGFKLLKEESEAIYGCDVKDQAEAAIYMAGVVEAVSALRELFEFKDEDD